ncbi:MAG: CHASE2 domain-containing protein [Opitutaceae bacterium]
MALWFGSDLLALRQLEWLAEKFRLQLRERWAMVPPTGEVVLMAIDEKSLVAQGQWPFTRSVHGQLMEYLGKDAGVRPAVMSWDFVFTEETFDPALDRMFAEPLKNSGYPILMGAFTDPAARGIFSQGKGATTLGLTKPLVLPPEVVASLRDLGGMQIPIGPLLETTRFVLLDADADEDGVIRQIPLVVRVGDRAFPGLVMGTLMAYWKVTPGDLEVQLGDAVIVHALGGDHRIPIDDRGFYHLNYRYEMQGGKTVGIPVASYQDTLDALLPWAAFGDAMPKLAVAGKIVVVGQTATGLTDIGPSPLRSQSGKVLVHLNAIENILRNDYLVRTAVWPGLVVMLVIGLGAAWVLDSKRSFYFVGVGFLVVVVAAVAWGLLVVANLMVPLAVPVVAFGIQQAAVTMLKIREEQAQRDRIRRMFGSYVSPELVRRMVETRAEPQLGGHEDEITAFFSDIQGFSAFSEVLTPVDLVQLLNEYLGGMTDILQETGGALDKYIGDAIVAMFGGLVPLADHARRACESAARMQQRQAELRARWKAEGDRWPALVHNMRTRIGLNSGQVVVGNMGSQHRFNYTMMGDTVNLAARCESGAKSFGVYTAATGATVSEARASGCECVFRELDRIVVKGRKEPAEIFEIVALSPEHLPEGGARCLELFAAGRAHYLKQEWDEAIRCFDEASSFEPLQPERDAGVENNPSLLMRARCEKLKAHPPGADWDGVYRMTTK